MIIWCHWDRSVWKTFATKSDQPQFFNACMVEEKKPITTSCFLTSHTNNTWCMYMVQSTVFFFFFKNCYLESTQYWAHQHLVKKEGADDKVSSLKRHFLLHVATDSRAYPFGNNPSPTFLKQFLWDSLGHQSTGIQRNSKEEELEKRTMMKIIHRHDNVTTKSLCCFSW